MSAKDVVKLFVQISFVVMTLMALVSIIAMLCVYNCSRIQAEEMTERQRIQYEADYSYGSDVTIEQKIGE